MKSEQTEKLRQQLLEINNKIAYIELNHHLEKDELYQAKQQLEELKKEQENIRNKLKHSMYQDAENIKGR